MDRTADLQDMRRPESATWMTSPHFPSHTQTLSAKVRSFLPVVAQAARRTVNKQLEERVEEQSLRLRVQPVTPSPHASHNTSVAA